ncbi:MAG: UbiH/UbiF family hydroxylase [Burkholderiales bacterium]
MIIAGAGLVGSSFALALRSSGLRLALVESHAPACDDQAGHDDRIYALSPGTASFLDGSGVWQRLDSARITPITEMQVYGDDGASRLDFSAYDCGLPELAFTAENRLLQHVMWQQLGAQQNLTLICPGECEAIEWAAEYISLRLKDGSHLDAKLLVGADGGDSRVREQAGIDASQHPYQQLAVVANFEAEKPHRNIAYQWFRQDGVLAYLPLPEKRISIVWSTGEDHAQSLLALAQEQFCSEVAKAGGNELGDLRMITLCAAFPLKLLRVERLVNPRIALIGDAAHVVHPLAGQGVNLGFQDARVLAETLMNRGVQADCGDYHLLRRYERARKEDILAMQLTTHGLQRLFSNPWLSGLRNFGLKLTNGLPQIKNFLVQRALN